MTIIVSMPKEGVKDPVIECSPYGPRIVVRASRAGRDPRHPGLVPDCRRTFAIRGDVANDDRNLQVMDKDNNCLNDDIFKVDIHIPAGGPTTAHITFWVPRSKRSPLGKLTELVNIVPWSWTSMADRRDFWGPLGWKVRG